jgi:nucleoside-diphosphate-sugar epimerase
MKKVLILGVNGFIGSALTEEILAQTDWSIYGMDMASDKISEFLDNSRMHFVEGDITINKEWISYHIKKCDVVLPLVAIATPIVYVTDPLRVFELDFEANLEIVRQCVRHQKRIIFPSTSEVYGMSPDTEFDEETSPLVLGPISKQRWIYSCSKQLLDRVIYAYGIHNNLDYTLFRPFNWIGPKLDNFFAAREGSSRVLTQFIADILERQEIKLVDGGQQNRSFTDIDDGIDALMRIIENKDRCAQSRIFNLGNPQNNVTIQELAYLLIATLKTYPTFQTKAEKTKITIVNSQEHYGTFYQDIQNRLPSIRNAQKHLGWTPQISLEDSLRKTLDYHLSHSSITLMN